MLALARKYPLSSYFVLTFALSWGAVLAVIGSGPIPAPPEQAQRLFVRVYLGMLLGPVSAGVLMTMILGGVDALRALGRRLVKWRVGRQWFVVALGTAPIVLAATLILLSTLPGDFTPGFLNADSPGPLGSTNAFSFFLTAIAVGAGAGFLEEIGWTGFATSRLLQRRRLSALLLLGAMWGAWHFLVGWWGSADAFGAVPVAVYMLVTLFSFLPPYRILMMWVYERTESLLVAVLMHASLTSSMLIFGPAVTGIDVLLYNLVFSGLLWCLVVLAVMMRARQRRAPSQVIPIAAR